MAFPEIDEICRNFLKHAFERWRAPFGVNFHELTVITVRSRCPMPCVFPRLDESGRLRIFKGEHKKRRMSKGREDVERRRIC